jgi:hypothetical protein
MCKVPDNVIGRVCLVTDSVPILQYCIQCRGSGFRREKMTHKNRKKLINLIAGCSLLRAGGFYCSLDILYEGLGLSKFQFLIKEKMKKNFICFFSS